MNAMRKNAMVVGACYLAVNVIAAPLGLQEIALALWLIIKGFNPDAMASEPAAQS